MGSVKLKSLFFSRFSNYSGLLGLIRSYNVKGYPSAVKLDTLSKYNHRRETRNFSFKPSVQTPLRVLFFGTDDFSVASLKTLLNELKHGTPSQLCQLDVVCTTKSKINPVRAFASTHKLTVLDWPPRILPHEYDVGLVVSFGQLIPAHLIESFKFGMLNVHASLLPRWRGAAPIIYALLNGDTETGITIMQIRPEKFDIGGIVRQERCPISQHELMPDLSARLSKLGATLLLNSLRDLPQSLLETKDQPEAGVTYAPRVNSSLSRVNWQEMDSTQVYNLSRALHGLYSLTSWWHGQNVKLLQPSLQSQVLETQASVLEPGRVEFHRQSKTLRVHCRNQSFISFSSIVVAGKRPMKPIDFYNGYISKCEESERRFN